ncbi:MAG: hypothetical protein HY608_08325 [Planctomycetes bacterium]|nr:hypothetical protein [Planctomycetota bacterium]
MRETDTEFLEGRGCPGEAIAARIPSATEAALHGLVENPACTPDQVLRILQRRPLPDPVIRRIAETHRWRRNHRIRAAVVNHPSTPTSVRLDLLGHLLWRELAQVAANPHLPPQIRRKGEHTLLLRLAGFTLGERIALARIAPRGLIGTIRTAGEPEVIGALLENPRTTEADALAIALRSRTPASLRCLAEHPAWSVHPAVRTALLGNPSLPVHVALRLLRGLRRREVQAIARRAGAPGFVVLAARRLLGECAPERAAGPEGADSPAERVDSVSGVK